MVSSAVPLLSCLGGDTGTAKQWNNIQ